MFRGSAPSIGALAKAGSSPDMVFVTGDDRVVLCEKIDTEYIKIKEYPSAFAAFS